MYVCMVMYTYEPVVHLDNSPFHLVSKQVRKNVSPVKLHRTMAVSPRRMTHEFTRSVMSGHPTTEKGFHHKLLHDNIITDGCKLLKGDSGLDLG